MLKTRVVAAAIFAPALLALVYAGGAPLRMATAVLTGLMLWEAQRLLLARAPKVLRAALMGVGLLTCAQGLFLLPTSMAPYLPGTCAVLVLIAALCAPVSPNNAVRDGALALLGAWYAGGLMPLLWQLRELPEVGLGLALMALFCTWAADTGAYFTGRAWGRRKLLPRVSPGKTLEGALGGLVAAMLMAWALWVTLSLPLGLAQALTLGLVAATLGTLGDLCESLIKRAAGAKDSSQLIPGHGGVLDRFDGVLFAVWGVRAYAVWLLGLF